jgi:hypothetical protein
MGDVARGILARLPELFDIEAAEAKYPQVGLQMRPG